MLNRTFLDLVIRFRSMGGMMIVVRSSLALISMGVTLHLLRDFIMYLVDRVWEMDNDVSLEELLYFFYPSDTAEEAIAAVHQECTGEDTLTYYAEVALDSVLLAIVRLVRTLTKGEVSVVDDEGLCCSYGISRCPCLGYDAVPVRRMMQGPAKGWKPKVL